MIERTAPLRPRILPCKKPERRSQPGELRRFKSSVKPSETARSKEQGGRREAKRAFEAAGPKGARSEAVRGARLGACVF